MSHTFRKGLACLIPVLLLNIQGCGDSSAHSNPNGTPQPQQGLPLGHQTVIIQTEPYFHVDNDTNDPGAPLDTNNTFEDAQPIGSPSITPGFVSFGYSRAGRFTQSDDRTDTFRTSLEKGQRISLTAILNGSEETIDPAGDLDLYLYDADESLIKTSMSENNTEFISIDTTGDYYLQVIANEAQDDQAYSASYRLEIHRALPVLFGNGINQSSRFVPDVAVVQHRQPANFALSATRSGGRPTSGWTKQYLPQKQAHRALTPLSLSAQRFRDNQIKLNTLAQIKALRHQDDIVSAEPDFILKPQSITNDPLSIHQWHLDTIGFSAALPVIDSLANASVTVAVIDSGIYLGHEDMPGSIKGYDFIADPSNACDGDGLDDNPEDTASLLGVEDSDFHGTLVAGIISAYTDNGKGIAGLFPSADIMPLRVIGCTGEAQSEDIRQALRYAAGLPNDSNQLPEKRADIINLSLGSTDYSQATMELIQDISAMGILVVAAAGNDNNELPYYPAGYPDVFSVSATNRENRLSSYSNYGNFIDLAAPAGDLSMEPEAGEQPDGLLTIYGRQNGDPRINGYVYADGTSLAAPVVASVFAMMKSINRDLTRQQTLNWLRQGKLTTGYQGNRDYQKGYGIISAEQALVNTAAKGEATLYTDKAGIHLNRLLTESIFQLNRTEGLPVIVENIQSNEPWLAVKAVDIDGQGLGRYKVQADTDSLTQDIHEAQVTITTDQLQTLTISINLDHRKVTNENPATGRLYLLLLDPENESTRYDFALNPDQLNYRFTLSFIEPSDYLVVLGSDINGNGIICEPMDYCSVYADSPLKIQSGSDNAVVPLQPVIVNPDI